MRAEAVQCRGLPCCLLPPHTHVLDLLTSQMYVQHDIYDLIFKYVGTMEAAEVGSPSSPCRMEALLSKPFQTFEASLKSLVRMLPLTKSRGAFKIFSRRISVLNLSSGRVYTAALASSGAGPLCPLEARPSVAVLALVDMVQTAEQGSYL